MKKLLKVLLIVILISILVPVIGLGVLSYRVQNAEAPGLIDGSLAECPESPNCVCSQSQSPDHQIEAIPFKGDGKAALARMRSLLSQLPRSELVSEKDNYLHVVVRSALFRFPDDVEVLLDEPDGLLQIRSASRAGKSDLGVNRERVELIRSEFAAGNS